MVDLDLILKKLEPMMSCFYGLCEAGCIDRSCQCANCDPAIFERFSQTNEQVSKRYSKKSGQTKRSRATESFSTNTTILSSGEVQCLQITFKYKNKHNQVPTKVQEYHNKLKQECSIKAVIDVRASYNGWIGKNNEITKCMQCIPKSSVPTLEICDNGYPLYDEVLF